MTSSAGEKIAVVGLGYVGLPLALVLSRHYAVVGFDISSQRIAGLKAFEDRSGEVEPATLRTTTMSFTDQIDDITGSDIFIVTVQHLLMRKICLTSAR